MSSSFRCSTSRAPRRLFQQIAEAHINVRYSYLATGNRLVIALTNPQAVLAAVGS